MTLEEHNKLFWDRVCRWWRESEEAKKIEKEMVRKWEQSILEKMRALARQERLVKEIEDQNREPKF